MIAVILQNSGLVKSHENLISVDFSLSIFFKLRIGSPSYSMRLARIRTTRNDMINDYISVLLKFFP